MSLFVTLIAVVPPVTVTLVDPSRDLKTLLPVLSLLAKADPTLHPNQVRRRFEARFGVSDPFSAESWANLGIDIQKPIHLLATEESWVLEATLSDAKKTVFPKGEILEIAKPPWSRATVISTDGWPVLIAITGTRLVALELIRGADPSAAFRESELLERKRSRSKGPWRVHLSEIESIESAELSIEIEPKRFTIDGGVRLVLPARLLSDEIVARSPARKLLEAMPSRAVTLSGTAGPGAIREALVEAGLPVKEADEARKLFSGEHSVALAEDGTLAGAARISGSAKEASIDAFVARMKEVDRALRIQRSGPFLVGRYAGSKESAVTKWLDAPSIDGASSAAAVELDANPTALFSALRKRARSEGPRIGLGRLTLVEALYGPLLEAMTRIHMTTSRGPGALDIDATIDIE